MIEYSQEEWVNFFVPEQSAAYLAVLFAKDFKACSPLINTFLHRFIDLRPKDIKENKDKCEKAFKRILAGKRTEFPELDKLVQIEGKDIYSLNMIHSLTRIPEWYMYTEKYLSEVYAPSMKEHLKDINALALDEKEYPYDKSIGLSDDIFTDLDKQEESVLKYIKDNLPSDSMMNKRVTKQAIKDAINQIKRWCGSNILTVPEYARPWVSMIQDIRRDIYKVNDELDEVLANGFNVDQLTVSESICYLNDEKWARNIVSNALLWGGKDGKGKISALIGNIFHLFYKGVPIPKTGGQIDLYNEKIDMLFSKAAPGLGPAYKIRIVFSTSSEIQNFTEIPAKFLKKYHQLCYHHAYLDQTGYILSNSKFFHDVQCTDCTGYSDYLNRNIYRLIMEIMGFKKRHIDILMNILGMPVKVVDEIYPVPFGSLQGVKFLVYIMNDANAFIGLIQNIIRLTKWDSRQNAGDDVYAASRNEDFTETDLNIDMAVWLWFNCPTNMSKSAWLKRDGYWDFCKVFFGDNGIPLTGLPPKMYNKEILSIRDVSEIYKNFDRTGVQPLRTIEEFTEILHDHLMAHWKEGMKLSNPVSDLNLEAKVKVAKELSYKIGGLSSEYVSDEYKMNHLIGYCYELFNSYDIQVGDIYTWAIRCGFTGVIGEFLLTIKSLRAHEFIEYLRLLNDIVENYKSGCVFQEDIDTIETDFERMTRIYLDSGKVSASGSTYHRITPKRSGDTTLIEHKDYLSSGIDLPYKVPSSLFDTVALAHICHDVEMANVSRLNLYAIMSKLYNRFNSEGRIILVGGGNQRNAGQRYCIKDKQGRRFRLYDTLRDQNTKGSGIYNLEYCVDKEEKFFIENCRKYKLFEGIVTAQQARSEICKEIAEDLLKDLKEQLGKEFKRVYGPDSHQLSIKAQDVASELTKKYRTRLNG